MQAATLRAGMLAFGASALLAGACKDESQPTPGLSLDGGNADGGGGVERFLAEGPASFPDSAAEHGPLCTVISCAGCCMDDMCHTGDTLDACGRGAAACAVCASGDLCIQGACSSGPDGGPDQAPAMDSAEPEVSSTCAMTCPGCCKGSQCLPGTTSAACGFGGAACQTCGPGARCDPASYSCGP